MVTVRPPSQAGAFYAGTSQSLKKQIENCFLHPLGPGKIPQNAEGRLKHVVGTISPHAGYMYSGPVAAHGYYRLGVDGKPDLAVILGPNHTSYGSPLAIMNEGVWRTPLGDLEVEGSIADQIVQESGIVDVDASAHRMEHSIEVQVPFLQYLYGTEIKIIPICFSMQDLQSARDVGEAVGKVLKDKNAVIIASSDMTHYESQKSAEMKDRLALDTIEKMDEEALYSAIERQRITACGYGPISSLIAAARLLGTKEAKLLCHKTSGDITGDHSSVVGYASVCFEK